jgi:hypothetical protein
MPTTGRRRLPILFAVGLCAGVIAVLAGAMWMTFVTPTSVWSQQQAEEFDAANAALHAVRAKYGAAVESAAAQGEVAAAQHRFNRIESQLESARYAHERWGTWISAGGLAIAAICGLGLLSVRGADNS